MDDQSPEVVKNGESIPRLKMQYSPFAQLCILVGFAMMGLIAGSFAGVIPFLIKGISFSDLINAINNPAYASLTRISQIISTLFTFMIPVWLFTRVVAPKEDYLKIKTVSAPTIWLLVTILAFASMPVTDLMGTINYLIPIPKNWAIRFEKLEDNYNQQVANIMQMHTLWDLFVSVFIVALLPAVFEEAFFRGGLQNVFLKWLKFPFLAILLTSIIFSAIHVSYYGFIPRAFLGLLLGYVYYWTKDIKLNMLIHFINNGVSVVSMYYLSKKGQLTSEKMNEHMAWYSQIFGLLIFIVLLVALKKQTQKQLNN